MMRLDHNRAIAQLAAKLEVAVTDVSQMGVWGNHSPTMFPDLFHAKCVASWRRGGRRSGVDRGAVPPERRKTGGGDHRGARRLLGRVGGQRGDRPRAQLGLWKRRRMGLDGRRERRRLRGTRGSDLGFPCTCADGEWSIVTDLDLDDFSRSKIDASVAELIAERDTVKSQDLI